MSATSIETFLAWALDRLRSLPEQERSAVLRRTVALLNSEQRAALALALAPTSLDPASTSPDLSVFVARLQGDERRVLVETLAHQELPS